MAPSKRKSRRKEPPSPEGEGGAKKKKYKYTCKVDGCTNKAQNGGRCYSHGAKRSKCSAEGCTKNAQNGGRCYRHGAKRVRPTAERPKCSAEGCTSFAINRGVCIRHGAEKPRCSVEGCTNQAQLKGVCIQHGAKRAKCSAEGCTNNVVKGGVCVTHGAKRPKPTCKVEECTNIVRSGGMCRRHYNNARRQLVSDDSNGDGGQSEQDEGATRSAEGAELQDLVEQGEPICEAGQEGLQPAQLGQSQQDRTHQRVEQVAPILSNGGGVRGGLATRVELVRRGGQFQKRQQPRRSARKALSYAYESSGDEQAEDDDASADTFPGDGESGTFQPDIDDGADGGASLGQEDPSSDGVDWLGEDPLPPGAGGGRPAVFTANHEEGQDYNSEVQRSHFPGMAARGKPDEAAANSVGDELELGSSASVNSVMPGEMENSPILGHHVQPEGEDTNDDGEKQNAPDWTVQKLQQENALLEQSLGRANAKLASVVVDLTNDEAESTPVCARQMSNGPKSVLERIQIKEELLHEATAAKVAAEQKADAAEKEKAAALSEAAEAKQALEAATKRKKLTNHGGADTSGSSASKGSECDQHESTTKKRVIVEKSGFHATTTVRDAGTHNLRKDNISELVESQKENLVRNLASHNAELRPSGIHGIGVFALAPIPRGTVLFQFNGEPTSRTYGLTSEEIGCLPRHVQSSLRKFILPDEEGLYHVPEHGLSCALGVSFYLNSTEGTDHEPNVEFGSKLDASGFVEIVATMDIEEGEELLLPYQINSGFVA